MTEAQDRPLASLRVGETASFEHTISEADVRAFADLSGDHSPLHIDDVYAHASAYAGLVVHGMFLGALVSRLVGMHLPGKRALLLAESLTFKKPVYIGDTVHVEGVIAHVSDATQSITVDIRIHAGGVLVAAGEVHAQVRAQ